ncbi:hypothetical protein [Bifidobacterium moukalabense]|nr:hypothetical protein [Bifidobacterium moukalabense]
MAGSFDGEMIPLHYDSGTWSSGPAESTVVEEAVGHVLGYLR